MNRIYQLSILSVLVMFLTNGIVFAEESKAKDETVNMKTMPTNNAAQMEHLRKMQAHILAMHELSTKILAEKDPKKQEELKNQQLELMKAHMVEKMAHHHEMMKAK